MIAETTVLVHCIQIEETGEILIDGRLWTDLDEVGRLDLLSDWIGGLTQVYNSMLSERRERLVPEKPQGEPSH